VRHILIKTPMADANGKVDQAAVDAAKNKAESIEKQLKAGANFADLATKNSDDPGSAKNGGLLPPLKRGQTVPEFEKAAFSTPPGQTTGIIRTSYGFHIIHVESKQEPRLKPLDEVKAQIQPILQRQKAAVQAQSLGNTVQTLARTEGLDKAAADKGLTVTSTPDITKADQLPGLPDSGDLVSAIFSANKNDPPSTAHTPEGLAVYQVTEIQPPQTPSFDQIRAQVEEQFRDQRAQALIVQKTQELADRAKANHDLKKVAKELGATVKTSDLVDPSGQVPDVGAMSGGASVAFTMKPGEISGPIQGGSNGIVLSLVEKQEPSAAEVKQNWDRAKDSMLQQKRTEYEQLYVQNLRDQLEKHGVIKINKKEMDRLKNVSEGS
jgi:peptidyl-prolyl cis-trans isomerase D